MEFCFCFSLFFVAIVSVSIGFAFAMFQLKQRDSAFQQLARKYGGASRDGGFWGEPTVQFRYQGVSAMVDTYSTGGQRNKHYIQLRIRWPQPDLRCEVYPEGFFFRLGKLIGMDDVEIGSPHFDRGYIIRGGSKLTLSQVLTPAVQQVINRLRRLWNNEDIYILWSSGVLLVKKLGRVRSYQDLSRFVTLALKLYDVAMAMKGEGVTFVEPEAEQAELASDPVVCQVCGDEIQRDVVFCRSCKTPHHQDCWQYYGACSTYGCGQTKYSLPRKKRKRRK